MMKIDVFYLKHLAKVIPVQKERWPQCRKFGQRISTYYMITLILLLTQLSNLPVEGAANRPPMEGQPGQTVMAHCVTAEQKARNLVTLEGEDVLTHATL